jgi:hypothetical protein
MRVPANLAPSLALAALSASLASCGSTGDVVNCIPPPCAVTVVITISVTAAGGGPVSGAFVKVSGPVEESIACPSSGTVATCTVPGFEGTYSLLVGATGFDGAQRTVVVAAQDNTVVCQCPNLPTQHLDVALVATS